MNKNLEINLKNKGWSDEEIFRAKNTMLNHDKKPLYQFFDKIIYWIALLILIFGNFFMSLLLIPSILLIEGILLYVIIGVIALLFGFFYDLIIRELEKLEIDHKIVEGLFIPVLSIINIYIIIGLVNYTVQKLNYENQNNLFVVGVIYITFFILPYIMNLIEHRNTK